MGSPESKWIRFEEFSRSLTGRTTIWEVAEKQSHGVLGQVRWFARWRCYGFYPHRETIFEQQCLRDIADFCEQRTKDHRVGLAAVSPSAPTPEGER